MQGSEAPTASAAIVTTTVAELHASTPAFVVGTLGENEADDESEGCVTSLTQMGAAASGRDIFRVIGEARGLIRINGTLIHVSQVHAESREDGEGQPIGSMSVFEDASHATRVVATLKFGAYNEAADSTEHTGTLTITYKGLTQRVRVEGGTAC